MSGNGNPTLDARMIALGEAASDGHFIMYGDEYTLQLDLDTIDAAERADLLLAQFGEHIAVTGVTCTTSKSGNFHYYVRLAQPMAAPVRIFWQTIFGSDPVREALNWLWEHDPKTKGTCFLVETKFGERVKL